MSKWRYQPVIIDDEGTVSLCEAYFDADDKLEKWTDARMDPMGESIEGLTGDIVHMLVDAYSWKPVEFAKLEPGMTFERAITMEQRTALAKFAEVISFNCKQAQHEA